MKKINEYENEEAIELLADLFDPVTKIMLDEDIMNGLSNVKTRAATIPIMLKKYSKQVVEILAILDGVPLEEYKCNVFTLPKKIMDALNDKDLMAFFSSVAGTDSENVFGSATENTEEKENTL